MSVRSLLFYLFFLTATSLQAQRFLVERLDAGVAEGASRNLLVYYPMGYDALRAYPLVVYAHGLSGAGTSTDGLFATGLPKVLRDGYRPPFDFILIVPQSPTYSPDPAWLPSLLDWSRQRWKLDTNRFYLTGVSQGGWAVLGSQLNVSPELGRRFAGLVVHSAGTQNLQQQQHLRWWAESKTPLWALVGSRDPGYLLQNQSLVEALNQEAPGTALLTIRSGLAHGGWDDLYRGKVTTPNGLTIWQWMQQQTSNKQITNTAFARELSSTTTGTRYIKVNIYGGANPYTNTEWNNWNVVTSLSSGPLKYSDATVSAVNVALSQSNGASDNGATYGGTMAPPQVLRYASPSSVTRTLTITGLSATVTYNIELYASRNNTGNSTGFSINGVVQNVTTDKNLTNKIVFTGVAPVNGQIIVTLKNNQAYNYINGFILTENALGTEPSPPPPAQPVFANYTIPITSGTVNYSNGFPFPNLKPGDTINVAAGTYTALIFGNFKGSATNPIIIRNKGGLVKADEIRILNDAQYFKLLGNGAPAVSYGFKIYRTVYSGISVSKARDFEIGYCEVSGMTSGIFIKNNPVSTDPSTVYPNYIFKNIYLHHNYVHDIKNEGFYIGHTDPDGGQGGNPLIPVRMENVEIAYNTVNNTGWDGIQLANATTGNKIHHNTVTNFGTLNISGQQAAIQIGANSNVSIYENTVKEGTGNGIQVFGYGYTEIYNNLLENCAKDGSLKGRETIYCSPYVVGPEVSPKQQVNIFNNTIKYPQPFGAIRVGGVATNSLPSTIKDNKLLIVNAPANWQSIHTFSVVAGSIITGNTLITQ